jgi:N-acetylmuramoyl-L-alanine amidase
MLHKIVLDPGHGKNKKGQWQRPLMTHSSGETYREDMGTLEICKLLKRKLTEEGFRVYLTREDERSAKLFLEEKFNASAFKKNNWSVTKWIRWFTESKNPDLFLSIHTNAGKGSGPIAFWNSKRKSEKLGKFLVQEISKELGVPIRGNQERSFLILRNTAKGPEILLECLFHDNDDNLEFLINDKDKIADAIASAIVKYFNDPEK